MALDPLVKKEREEQEESLEQPDPSDPQEREELPVTVVSQDRMVLLELRAPLASEVFLVLLGPKVAAETPDAQERPVCPEPEVLLVAPEMLDLKAKLEPLDLMEMTVAPDPPALWEPVDSPA